MINPMSANNEDAIHYLNERSKENKSLEYAWKVLKAYYDECLKELDGINTFFSPFEDESEKKNIFDLVKQELKDKSFKEEASEFIGVPSEELLSILNKKETSVFDDWMIAKTNRLYNMKLKLGHSARITYIAETNLNSMLKDNDYINRKILENAVILSALLHDIGRFYQAVHYNNLIDKKMKDKEKDIAGLKVDHAIAGYYYSLATSIEFHKLIKEDDIEKIENFINQTVAAIVVRFHQNANSDLSHFDFNGDISILNDENMISDLLAFINTSYEDAKIMNYKTDSRMDPKQKEFIDNFVSKIKKIIKPKNIDYSVSTGFMIDTDFVDGIYTNIESGISEVMKSSNEKTLREITEEIITIINKEIKRVSKIKLEDDEIDRIKNEIEIALNELLNYDISESVNRKFMKNDKIEDTVRFMLSCAMSNTMDADKIDILNQRALGIYNASYKMESFQIFPTENTSLVELLNNYFKFNLKKEEIILDKKVIDTINNSSKSVKSALSKYLYEFNIFTYDELKREYNIKDNIIIKISNDKIKVLESGETREYTSPKLNDMFTEDYLEFLCNICDVEQKDFRSLKNNYYNEFKLTISADDLDNNIDNKGVNKVDTYKKLLITDDLIQRFMLKKENKPLDGWIKVIDEKRSDYLIHSSITGLLWQINQFLFVNMRNRHSYEFIEKYHILDDILLQYERKSPELGIILKEYIDYAKEFVNYMVKNVQKEMLTEEDLEKARITVYNNKKQKGKIK